MRRFSGLMLLLAVLLAMGCGGGARVSQDYAPDIDFTRLKTYAWLPGAGGGEGATINVLVAGRIRGAVERVLEEKGFRQAAHGTPDMVVDFRYRIQRGYESSGLSTGVGLGTGRGGTFGGIGIGMGDYGREYDEAVLSIDFLDHDSGTLMWQGTGRRRASTRLDPDQSAREIHETVAQILAQFPPQKK